MMEGKAAAAAVIQSVSRHPNLTYLNTDCVNPLFDPSRVLLRRVFLDPKKLNTSLWDFIPLEIITPNRDQES